jgi:hypothetical protein
VRLARKASRIGRSRGLANPKTGVSGDDPHAAGYTMWCRHGHRTEYGRTTASSAREIMTSEDAKGKAKEAVGGATDDESLKAEGEAGQASADVRQAG